MDSVEQTKRCSKCFENKPITEFYRRKDTGGWRAECKWCVTQRTMNHAKDVPEKTKARQVAWVKANPDRVKANWQKYFSGKADHVRQLWRDSQKRCRDNDRLKSSRRRALKVGNGGAHTQAEWDALCEKYGYRCLCCLKVLPLEIDHVLPLTKGGTDDIGNLQPLCAGCNKRKSNKHIDYRMVE